jgi:hypothetical protein
MSEPSRYEARFDTTNDPVLDGQTTELEDNPLTLDQIKAACRRYGVRARYRDEKGELHELDPRGEAVEPSIRRT